MVLPKVSITNQEPREREGKSNALSAESSFEQIEPDAVQRSGRKFFSTALLAQEFGYDPDHIGRLARQGKVDSVRVEKRWYVSRLALAEYKREAEDLRRQRALESVRLASKSVQNSEVSFSVPLRRLKVVAPSLALFHIAEQKLRASRVYLSALPEHALRHTLLALFLFAIFTTATIPVEKKEITIGVNTNSYRDNFGKALHDDISTNTLAQFNFTGEFGNFLKESKPIAPIMVHKPSAAKVSLQPRVYSLLAPIGNSIGNFSDQVYGAYRDSQTDRPDFSLLTRSAQIIDDLTLQIEMARLESDTQTLAAIADVLDDEPSDMVAVEKNSLWDFHMPAQLESVANKVTPYIPEPKVPKLQPLPTVRPIILTSQAILPDVIDRLSDVVFKVYKGAQTGVAQLFDRNKGTASLGLVLQPRTVALRVISPVPSPIFLGATVAPTPKPSLSANTQARITVP
ncbi:MAG: helix-turn-helix domain-containing protein, partial [Candidatus Yanofskybacteria bacterium]|nr:helix-turn-helix domain-containing protein [Candidatus Yanofskybacteria bacterium]